MGKCKIHISLSFASQKIVNKNKDKVEDMWNGLMWCVLIPRGRGGLQVCSNFH